MRMTDKFFSVVAELEDGTSKVLPVRAGAPGEAFRRAREVPGVRRVGRVVEISEAALADLGQGRAAAVQAPAAQQQPVKTNPESRALRPVVPHVISGPRTVVYAPPARGEQPFKNFTVPPERLKPAEAPKPQPAKVIAPPKPVAQPKPAIEPKPAAAVAAVQPAESDDSMRISQSPSPTEYRIVKSRRRDGLPYLVQRGQWQQVNGRRTFDMQWEKGFADRDAAEKHLGWIEHNEREMAALQSA
jgi:hypothetical protein